MRTTLLITAIFSFFTASAQISIPTSGMEAWGGSVAFYPTEESAAKMGSEDHLYKTTITDWQKTGNQFTASFTKPFAWVNRRVLLRLHGASGAMEIKINGRIIATIDDATQPSDVDITRQVKEGRNTLDIQVENGQSPFEDWNSGNEPIKLAEVEVWCPPTMYIRDVWTKAYQNSKQSPDVMAQVEVVVKSGALNPRTSKIHYSLLSRRGEVITTGTRAITLSMRGEDTIRFGARLPRTECWDADSAFVQTLTLKTQYEGRFLQYIEMPVGFRIVEMQETGKMAINGKNVNLQTKRVSPQIKEEEIQQLKQNGINTLFLQPGIVRKGLYDDCDRIGMYVIAQAPIDTHKSGLERVKGGNPSNDPTFKQNYLDRIMHTYYTAQGHPSVIAFSIANQSGNGINLYEGYLRIKKQNDTRPIIYRDAEGEWNNDALELKE